MLLLDGLRQHLMLQMVKTLSFITKFLMVQRLILHGVGPLVMLGRFSVKNGQVSIPTQSMLRLEASVMARLSLQRLQP